MARSFYSLLRPVLFALAPETAHHFSLNALNYLHALHLNAWAPIRSVQAPYTVMGLQFRNAVGLAAGLDKNGEYIDALAALGFGFIEVGTVTPRPQAGNPAPRLFRLPQSQALINRMGFNNHGVDALVRNVQRSRYWAQGGVVGLNIGKNAATPLEKANEDYLLCFERVYPFASYITVNISSPNTKNLRDLQTGESLNRLLEALKNRQQQLSTQHQRYVPLVVKIAPDLDEAHIELIAQTLLKYEIEGVIATNTTVARENLAPEKHSQEIGGLSGQPLAAQSNHVIHQLHLHLNQKIPIIGVGGIQSGVQAQQKIASGAALVQFYTGLIYRGPALVAECAQAIHEFLLHRNNNA